MSDETPSAFDTRPFSYRQTCIILNAGKYKTKHCLNDIKIRHSSMFG